MILVTGQSTDRIDEVAIVNEGHLADLTGLVRLNSGTDPEIIVVTTVLPAIGSRDKKKKLLCEGNITYG